MIPMSSMPAMPTPSHRFGRHRSGPELEMAKEMRIWRTDKGRRKQSDTAEMVRIGMEMGMRMRQWPERHGHGGDCWEDTTLLLE